MEKIVLLCLLLGIIGVLAARQPRSRASNSPGADQSGATLTKGATYRIRALNDTAKTDEGEP